MKNIISGLIAIVAFFAAQQAVSYFFTQNQFKNYTQEQLENDFLSETPKLISVLKNDFPEDYDFLISSTLREMKEGGTIDSVRTRVEESTIAIRHKYGAQSMFAPDQNLIEFVQGYLDFQYLVKSKDGDKLCAKVAYGGAGAIPDAKLSNYLEEIDALAATTFLTIKASIDNPTSRLSATDQDWGKWASCFQRMA